MKRERGISELYQNPERGDALVFGRRVGATRRGFLGRAGLAAMGAAVGAGIPFAGHMPAGLIPAAFAEGGQPGDLIAEKDGLRVLNDRPLNAETPPWLLDDAVTPNARHFVRNNGKVPPRAVKGDAAGWTLTVDGAVQKALTLDLAQLKRYPQTTAAVVLECGGNGRASFNPPAKGNQWTIGAVGCAAYTGVRLKDVLADAGVEPAAVYVGYYGEDVHLSGDPTKPVISRGVPIAKALDPDTLIAFEMNGAPLPALHGFPARLVVPGWPASVSGKWLRRLWVRDRVHDGPKMEAPSYRVPKRPVKPGSKVAAEDMAIIERMPVKSVITAPRSGIEAPAGRPIKVRGHAWSGERAIEAVHVSLDFGATWRPCALEPARNRHAWQRWTIGLTPPGPGYYEVWARATDDAGEMQPMVVPGWNPKGYLNNAMHRISLTVKA